MTSKRVSRTRYRSGYSDLCIKKLDDKPLPIEKRLPGIDRAIAKTVNEAIEKDGKRRIGIAEIVRVLATRRIMMILFLDGCRKIFHTLDG